MAYITRNKTGRRVNLPPEYALSVVRRLKKAGFEACFAGGCVRDTVLGRRPHDWDVASSAPPEALGTLFRRTVPTGIRHGTVTVLSGGGSVEVTAFRSEGAYSDHRRPDSVDFGAGLADDLARRDFTMNAMAMTGDGEILDPFGGREDMKKGLIRCVGDARARFEEDALRMLRALRFAAQLGFSLEEETRRAMELCAPLAALLSAERVRDEFEKALFSPAPELAWTMLSSGLMDRYARAEGCAPALACLPRYARLPRLCRELERRGGIASVDGFLRALRFDRRTVKTVSAAVEVLNSGGRDFKRLLRDYGEAAVLAARPRSRELRRVLASGECWQVSGLALGGAELLELGFSGREVGQALSALLEHVIDVPEDNRREILCKLISEERERYGKHSGRAEGGMP